VFPADGAAPVERLDADVVEITAAMDGRGRVRLRQHEQVGLARLPAQPAREDDRRGPFARAGGAQDAESRIGVAHQGVARAATFQLIVAVSEEHEVAVQHPGEQRPRFRRVGLRHR
jgi:hypothetical protein